MRIRSIKPEFWRSQDVADLPREVRLLWIGLWSYVDDNGVGVDDFRVIAAELFALDDPVEAREFVRDGLATLSRGFQIARYVVDGRSYLRINGWDEHQKIDHPGKSRFPLPPENHSAIEDGESPGEKPEPSQTNTEFATPSRNPRESVAPGTGEQGNRGTEKDTSADAANAPEPDPDPFDAFWSAYPRKDNKRTARKAFARTAKAHGSGKLIEEVQRWAGLWSGAGIEKRFIPHAATWLNQERWDDEPPPPRLRAVSGDPEDWSDAPQVPWWEQ